MRFLPAPLGATPALRRAPSLSPKLTNLKRASVPGVTALLPCFAGEGVSSPGPWAEYVRARLGVAGERGDADADAAVWASSGELRAVARHEGAVEGGLATDRRGVVGGEGRTNVGSAPGAESEWCEGGGRWSGRGSERRLADEPKIGDEWAREWVDSRGDTSQVDGDDSADELDDVHDSAGDGSVYSGGIGPDPPARHCDGPPENGTPSCLA